MADNRARARARQPFLRELSSSLYPDRFYEAPLALTPGSHFRRASEHYILCCIGKELKMQMLFSFTRRTDGRAFEFGDEMSMSRVIFIPVYTEANVEFDWSSFRRVLKTKKKQKK